MTHDREQYIRDWAQSKSEPLACAAMSELLDVIDDLRRKRDIRLHALERVEEYLQDSIHEDCMAYGRHSTCDCVRCKMIQMINEAIEL